MAKKHLYRITTRWTGNRGEGTSSYIGYDRAHEIRTGGKAVIDGSSDPSFRGDASRWNPEELLVASLSACHQLWYLHLCASNRIVVLAYEDDAEGVMAEEADGGGQFERIVLKPRVTLAMGSDASMANALHDEAGRLCFIQRSLRCEVLHEPTITQESSET